MSVTQIEYKIFLLVEMLLYVTIMVPNEGWKWN